MKLYRIGSTWKDQRYFTENELIDAVIFLHGGTKKEARAFLKSVDEERKIIILEIYNQQTALAAYYD